MVPEKIAHAIHRYWEEKLARGEKVEIWAPWDEVTETFLRDHPRVRLLPKREGREAGWVPWAGPRYHRILSRRSMEELVDLPPPTLVWDKPVQRVWGRMPTRRIQWPTQNRGDLYALLILLLHVLPTKMLGRWFALFKKQPKRFQEEVQAFLETFFRDRHHLHTLQNRFPQTFTSTHGGWQWEVPDLPAYIRRIERYPPNVVTEVVCFPEHFPIILHRLALLRPLDQLDAESPPMWPPPPEGLSTLPWKDSYVYFHGGWVWIPQETLPPRVCGGRHPLPGLLLTPPCPHHLDPPNVHSRYVLKVNGLSIPIDPITPEDLPPPKDVERIRIRVQDRGTQKIPPPHPLRLSDVVRQTPVESFWRLVGWLEALEREGLILAPHTREIHAHIPFEHLARRLLVRFLGDTTSSQGSYEWKPGDLVPLRPLMPEELVEIFPNHKDIENLQKLWGAIVRHWMAAFLPPAKVHVVQIEARYRQKVLGRVEVYTSVAEPGFALVAPPPLHPGLSEHLVPVRILREEREEPLSHRLARMVDACPETPLRELVRRVPV